ncbi:threonine/serine dehydratase [Hwanghaeella grinnelliae]|uniref:Threonine/serine dehydratase n=1 Tax=Hwanghaeella grinnelliae TaxID=2500179 RepID=A0A437QIP5_9PROT|nr:threonine/serine dehydratase [Hwanghaeella grinnelliae]RVU34240.1 threonine/serine dehydratase [Hwanghaeella grinnelliae]
MQDAPTLQEIEAALAQVKGRVIETPVVALASDKLVDYLPDGARVTAKLELFQQAGSFKARGALINVDALSADQKKAGVTAVSAGNHALATAWAAKRGGVHAKVVMMDFADPVRIEGCRAMGAEVVLVPDIHTAFSEVERIKEEEGRSFIHPFEGKLTALGTATCGLEFIRQVADMEAVVIPVGGGGLIAGMSRAIKLVNPDCAVYGVEPFGADSMYRSFASGKAEALEKVETIADSLGAPMALPYSFDLTHNHVDEIVRIEDAEMLKAGTLLFDALKLALEPAGAAATAATMGPLRDRLAGKRVGVIVCGSNIGEAKAADLIAKGRTLLG